MHAAAAFGVPGRTFFRYQRIAVRFGWVEHLPTRRYRVTHAGGERITATATTIMAVAVTHEERAA
jgi:hypothetical protein